MARRRRKSELDPTRGAVGKYRPEYCDRVYEFMSKGGSPVQFAALIGVAVETVYNWSEQREDFEEAFKKAKTASEAYWEKRFTSSMMFKDANTGMFNRYMSNRFKWNDKVVTDHQSSDGSMSPPTTITRTIVDVKES